LIGVFTSEIDKCGPSGLVVAKRILVSQKTKGLACRNRCPPKQIGGDAGVNSAHFFPKLLAHRKHSFSCVSETDQPRVKNTGASDLFDDSDSATASAVISTERTDQNAVGQFGVLIRAERYERYKAAMEAGRSRLNGDSLLFFFFRIDTRDPVAGDIVVIEYFDSLSKKESLAMADFAMGALTRLFPDSLMHDRDYFLFYDRFLNANLQAYDVDPLESSHPGSSTSKTGCSRMV
jgi:hypothetical protein